MEYSLAEQLYLYAHRTYFTHRLKNQVRFNDKYIISVGNLSAGGTGKTPTCALLLQRLSEIKQSPLALLRGYRSGLSRHRDGALVSDGQKILHDARAVGDEALLLARIPGIKVAIGKDRARAIELYGRQSKTVVLDDAFQNPSVYRDHDLVLIDITIPLEKMRPFPYGRMREPLTALKRAQSVLLSRFDQASTEMSQRLRKEVLKYVPEKALFYSRHKVLTLHEADIESPIKHGGNGKERIRLPREQPLGAFCGIANPQAFFHSLEELDCTLQEKRIFPDHHFYSYKELKALAKFGTRIWLTTAKDLARLQGFGKEQAKLNPESLQTLFRSLGIRVFVLEITVEILEGRQTEFLRRVLASE